MKRVLVIFFASVFVAALMSSCKTADCPAYSQVDVEQSTELPS